MKIYEVMRTPLPRIWRPGEASIPAGKVRRFHYTSPDRVESIRQNGLLNSHSQGHKFGDPNGIWSSPDFPFNHGWPRPVVEFWDDPEPYERHPYVRFGDIPPEQIVHIHEPWHETYHYAKDEGIPIKNFRRAQHADARYRMVADRLEREQLGEDIQPGNLGHDLEPGEILQDVPEKPKDKDLKPITLD